MRNNLSRSAVVDREECPRYRLLGTELDGTGYALRAASVATLSGVHIHEAFAFLLDPQNGDPTDPCLQDAAVARMLAGYTEEFHSRGLSQARGENIERVLREQQFLLEVMFRGWVHARLPHFLADYATMSVERAWQWELAPGLTMPFRFDVIVRRKGDGLLHVIDFKGTSGLDEVVQRKHADSRQTLLYLTALEEFTGEYVGGMVYELINRGSFKQDTAKNSPFFGQRIQQSSLTYGYRLPGDEDLWRTSYTSAAGWVKTGAYDTYTAKEWVTRLAASGDLAKLYLGTTPISPPPAFRQSIRRQIAYRELEFREGLTRFNHLRAHWGDDTAPAVQDHLERWAPQHTERCNKYGADYQCPFRDGDLCFQPNATELLTDDPRFQSRIPHHVPPGVE